jgi:hypothetical protein
MPDSAAAVCAARIWPAGRCASWPSAASASASASSCRYGLAKACRPTASAVPVVPAVAALGAGLVSKQTHPAPFSLRSLT